MGDGEWKEVSRKKKGLVFQRLQYPQSKASLADDLAKISLTVYVSNFPSRITQHEFWNICGKHGTLVSDAESLISLLSKVWIGKLRLHANVARYERKVNGDSSHGVRKALGNSSHVGVKVDPKGVKMIILALFQTRLPRTLMLPNLLCVQEDISNDFPLVLLGCYKDFRSIANTQFIGHSKGFLDVEFKYFGGLWVLFEMKSLDAKNKFLNHKGIATWFSSLKAWHDDFVVEERLIWLEIEGVPLRAWTNATFNQICRKWGEMIFIDDNDGCNRLSKRICIKSSHALLVYATIMVSVKDATYAIRVRELYSWMPTFEGDDSESIEEGSLGGNDNQEEKIFDNINAESVADLVDNIRNDQNFIFVEHEIQEDEIQVQVSKNIDVHEEADVNKQLCDSDPFELASLINKKCGKALDLIRSETPEFPLGYSPKSLRDHQVSEAFHKISDGDSHKQTGFSMIQRLEETIKVGMALGLNMEGCENTLASLVADNGEFTAFRRLNCYMLIYGCFVRCGVILTLTLHPLLQEVSRAESYVYGIVWWIVVYAPQNLSSKIALWSSLAALIATWDGILVVMRISMKESKLSSIDVKVDQGSANDEDLKTRSDLSICLGDLNRMDAQDLVQKAKIRWAIEGDENTKFFHGSLKVKRRQLAIRGILKDGDWIEDLVLVKDEFLAHFKNRFNRSSGMPLSLEVDMINHLSSSQSDFLEHQVSRDEIKRAI
ncbi:reverse transcriptase domain, reverse transcriptase zinc-binding domain protein [Tanacetum coccineum]